MSRRSVRFSVITTVLCLSLALPVAAADPAPLTAAGQADGATASQDSEGRQVESSSSPADSATADPLADAATGSGGGTLDVPDATAGGAGALGDGSAVPGPPTSSAPSAPDDRSVTLLVDGANPFRDLDPGHPYYAAILYLYDRGVVGGRLISPGVYEFNADDSLWRAQFAKMIVGAHEIPVSENMALPGFIDLGRDEEEPINGSDNLYPHEYVAAAAKYNITRGTSAQYFSPWQQISRAQVITMVVRSIENYVGWSFTEPSAAYWQSGSLRTFDDPTHGRNVHLAESSGLLDGIDLRAWDPWAPADRGETAQILYNMMVKFPLAAGVQVKADGTGVYPTLEAAVAGVQPGTTIHLGPGTFDLSSPLIIDKPVNLVGQGMDATFVTCSDEGFVVRFQGPGRHDVEGITFRHEGNLAADAVVARDTSVDFTGCRFSGGSRPAEWRGDGLWLEGSAPGVTATLTGCVAEANGRVGIEIKGAGRLTVVDSISRNNTYSGIAYFDGTEGSVRNSEFIENGSHGISLYGTAQPLLENNSCTDNTYSGIAYFDSSGGTARGNQCTGNGYYGFSVADTAAPVLEDNSCTNNTYSGIAYFDTTGGTARGNQCAGNGSHGIEAQGQAEPLLENNSCADNTYSGIAYFDTTGGTARGNQCAGNGSHGINAAGEAQPSLLDNTCAGNDRHGVHAEDHALVLVEGNVCNENGESGISFDGDASGSVSNNGCSENDLHGIAVAVRARPELVGNVCAGNGDYGIGYFGSAAGGATANECRGNLVGIFVESGADPTLLRNDCHDNITADVDDRRSI